MGTVFWIIAGGIGFVAFGIPLIVAVLMLLGVARVPLAYNVRNLVTRWRTTLLTMLAFTLVVGLMTVMLAFVNGMYELAKGSSVPGNVMVLADGALDEAFSDLGLSDIGLLANKPYVKKMQIAAGEKTQEVPMLSWELYQAVNQPLPHPLPGGRMRRIVQLRGIEDPTIASQVHQLALREGNWFDKGAGIQSVPGGGSEQFVQAVLGEGLARSMGADAGKPTLAVGDTFILGPRQWVVVGLMKSSGKTFDSEVWAKRKVTGEMLRKDTRSTAVFRVADDLDPAEVAKKIVAEFKSPAVLAQTGKAVLISTTEAQ